MKRGRDGESLVLPDEPRATRRRRRMILFLTVWLVLLGASWAVRLATPSPWTPPDEIEGGVRTIATVPAMDDMGRAVIGSEMRLAFHHWAPAEGGAAHDTPVFLLHGSPGNSGAMAPLGAELAQCGFEVYAIDLPGCGASSRWVRSAGAQAAASATLALMDELGIERAHLVGWSLAGVAVTLAADAAPERVATVTLLAATVTQEAEGSGNYRFERVKYALGYPVVVALPELLPHFGLLGSISGRHAMMQSFWETDLRPMRETLARLRVPTLIVQGRRDVLVPAWAAEHHHALVPDSRLVMLDEGHMLPVRAQDVVAPHLEQFFTRHDAPGVMAAPGVADFAPVRGDGGTDLGPFDIKRGMSVWLVVLLIVLATFVSEDATVIGVGLAIAHGHVDPFVGLLGCFTGIFLGDGGLWLLGRVLGRRAMRLPVVRAWVPEASLDRWGRWFDRHSVQAVFVARAFPGTRVPTYFAAGLLSKRTHGFLFWAALAAMLWTPILLALTVLVGAPVLEAFLHVFSGPVAVVLSILALLVAYRVVTYAFTWTGRRRLLRDAKTLVSPEFWPTWLFYLPLVPWVLAQAIRHGPMTFTCVNPGISHGGGVVGESKREILEKFSAAREWLAPTAYISAGPTPEERADEVERLSVERDDLGGYPLVLKPDAAQRGHGFKVAHDHGEALEYFREMTRDALVQAYHPGPHEIGVLWLREPGEERGRIFSITRKTFPVIEGDGHSTLEKLIWRHPRFRMQADTFLKRFDAVRDRVLAQGERLSLGRAGNHCQGTMFSDGADLITPALDARISEIANAFEGRGLDFGRFDIRYSDEDALKRGEDITIIELNGTMSESTNMYDPARPIWWKYAILLRQWATLYRIGAARRRQGIRPMRPSELLYAVRDHYKGRPGSAVSD